MLQGVLRSCGCQRAVSPLCRARAAFAGRDAGVSAKSPSNRSRARCGRARPRARRFLTRLVSRPTFGSTQGFASEHGGKKGLRSPEALAHMALQPDLYFISMAARLLDMHPQTLRKYERLGLVSPRRTLGSMRV